MSVQTVEQRDVAAARELFPRLTDPREHREYAQSQQRQPGGPQHPNFLLEWLQWMLNFFNRDAMHRKDEWLRQQVETAMLVARWSLPENHPDSLLNHTANQYPEAGVDLAVGYHAAVDAISLMPDAATRRERRAAGLDADVVDAVQEPTGVTSERVDPVPGATVLEAELVEEDAKRNKATARPDPDIVDAEVVSETPSARPEPRKPIALLEAAKSAPDAAPQPPAREQAPAATYPPAVTAGKALTTGATASAAPAAGGTPSAQSSVPAVATAKQVTNGQNAVSPSDGAGRNPAGGRTQVGGHGQDREAQQRKKLRT